MRSVDVNALLLHSAVRDPPGAHGGLSGERDDPIGPVGVLREVDVGLRRLGGAARMRVVDRDAVALVVELVGGEEAAVVELVAVRRRPLVDRAEDLLDRAVRQAHVAAALVGRLLAGVRDELVPVRSGDPHWEKASVRRMPARLTRRAALGGAAAVTLGACGGGDPAPAGGPEPGSGAAMLRSVMAFEHAAAAAWAAIGEGLRGDARGYARRIH